MMEDPISPPPSSSPSSKRYTASKKSPRGVGRKEHEGSKSPSSSRHRKSSHHKLSDGETEASTPGSCISRKSHHRSPQGPPVYKKHHPSPPHETTSPSLPRHSLKLPDNCDPLVHDVWVYEKPHKKHGSPIPEVADQRQGVWEDGYRPSVSPTLLWIYPHGHEPEHLDGSKHTFGCWGLRPGVPQISDCEDDELGWLFSLEARDCWFFSSKALLPKNFVSKGVWTHPLLKRDVSHLKPEQQVFLNVGETVKKEKLDIPGAWKLLYKKDKSAENGHIDDDDDDDDDVLLGPGLKSSSSSSSSPPPSSPRRQKTPRRQKKKESAAFQPFYIWVHTRDDTEVAISVMTNDSIADIKGKLHHSTKGKYPKRRHQLLFDGKKLEDGKTLSDYRIVDGAKIHVDSMFIYVKHWTGQKVAIDVLPHDTIEYIKEELRKRLDVPLMIQRLFFHDKLLKDDQKTVKEYKIPHRAMLKLKPMVIIIQMARGENVEVEVDPRETILDVKKKIENLTRKLDHLADMMVGEQRLLFKGSELEDDTTVAESGVGDGDIVEMEGTLIFIEDSKGEVFELDILPTDTIGKVKSRIEETQGIPISIQRLKYGDKILSKDAKTLRDYKIPHKGMLILEPMMITVMQSDGEKLRLAVNPDDLVDDVKTSIERETGIARTDQRLTYKSKYLGGATTLSENGIKNESTLNLEPMELIIRDSAGGRTLVGDVHAKDKILTIKKRIHEELNISVNQLRLEYQGSHCEDSVRLSDVGIKHKSILDLLPLQIVVILPAGRIVTVDMEPRATVADIKQALEDQEQIPIREQVLVLNEAELLDDSMALAEYDVKHEDTLTMEPMYILVNGWDCDNLRINVDPLATVGDVKIQLEDQAAIPVEHQHLKHDETSLSDGSVTLRAYHIPHRAVLSLQDMSISVLTPLGNKISIKVKPFDRVRDIKTALAKDVGISHCDQRLLFKGRDLDDDHTIDTSGIKDGSTLTLEGMTLDIVDRSNKRFTLDVAPSTPLGVVRTMIESEKGIPPEEQFLHFESELLEDDSMTMEEYDIPHEGTVHLDTMRIFVETPTGKFALPVDQTTSVDEIKSKVHVKTGIPVDSQDVEFKGQKLSSNSTIEENGVKYKDTVKVRADISSPGTHNPQFGTTVGSHADMPQYTVQVGPWQSTFEYTPKGKIKREGVRARKRFNPLLTEYHTTALNTEKEINRWGDDH